MDISIVEGISAAKAVLETVKEATKLLQRPNIDAQAVRDKLHEVLDHAVNTQIALGEARIEIFDLQRRVDENDGLVALRADFEYQNDGGFYFRKSERANGSEIYYCPVCFGETNKAIPLVSAASRGRFRCALHSIPFETSVYKTDQEQAELRRQHYPRPIPGTSWS